MTRDKKNYYLMNKTYNNFKIQNNVENFKADKVNNVSDGCESSAESVLNEQHLSLGLDSNISETFANSSQNDVEYMSTEVSIEDRISDSPRLLVVNGDEYDDIQSSLAIPLSGENPLQCSSDEIHCNLESTLKKWYNEYNVPLNLVLENVKCHFYGKDFSRSIHYKKPIKITF